MPQNLSPILSPVAYLNSSSGDQKDQGTDGTEGDSNDTYDYPAVGPLLNCGVVTPHCHICSVTSACSGLTVGPSL